MEVDFNNTAAEKKFIDIRGKGSIWKVNALVSRQVGSSRKTRITMGK
jgi:hypothetical protein